MENYFTINILDGSTDEIKYTEVQFEFV